MIVIATKTPARQHRDPALAGRVLRIFLEEVERALRRQCRDAEVKARTGAVVFPHRFGASLNAHNQFHVCVIDGVLAPDAQGGVRFFSAEVLDGADAEPIQSRVRLRILQAFTRRAILDKYERKGVAQWNHGGGFSLDAPVRIAANNRCALKRRLRFIALFVAQTNRVAGRSVPTHEQIP